MHDIKFNLKNFGPIYEANIDIKPLTVFIGKNNSGKSYAAMLFYSLMKAAFISYYYRRYPYRIDNNFKNYIITGIIRQIERVFDMELENLINIYTNNMYFSVKRNDNGYEFSLSKGSEPSIQLFKGENLKDLMFFEQTLILPSSREGLLQTYNIIAAKIVEMYSDLDRLDLTKILPLKGVIADFMHFLLNYIGKEVGNDDNTNLINEFNKIINGEIIIKNGKLYFKSNLYNTETEIVKASSGIQELTPLYLMIKHLELKNLLLIIEEPEAHLHPELIRKLATILALLIRRGVYIIITTHSDYLLSQLNLLIKVSKKDRKEFGYLEDEYLDPNEVSAYLFEYSEEHKASIAKRLTIDEEGIPEDEFTEVVLALHNEYARVE